MTIHERTRNTGTSHAESTIAATRPNAEPIDELGDASFVSVTPRAAFTAVTASSGALVLDVRTNAEWCLVGVPDLNDVLFLQWVDVEGTPNETFAEELRYWVHHDVPLFVLSRSGARRSLEAARVAMASGFTEVAVIADGFEGPLRADGRRGHAGWQADGLPWRQW